MNARAIFPVTRRYRMLRRPSEPIRPCAPRLARRDCHGRLIALLLNRSGGNGEVAEATSTPWASATFIGARHMLTLVLKCEHAFARAEFLAAQLPDAEFRIPGHVVADVAVDAVREEGSDLAIIRLSILTIEEW